MGGSHPVSDHGHLCRRQQQGRYRFHPVRRSRDRLSDR